MSNQGWDMSLYLELSKPAIRPQISLIPQIFYKLKIWNKVYYSLVIGGAMVSPYSYEGISPPAALILPRALIPLRVLRMPQGDGI
jgi:hypothetical protein